MDRADPQIAPNKITGTPRSKASDTDRLWKCIHIIIQRDFLTIKFGGLGFRLEMVQGLG